MCGIAGIISQEASEYIQNMTDIIAHRGPDDQGVFSEGDIGLGHRRLAIQDLTQNGHQPMFSGDNRFVLCFNGEIYNHWDIRNSLKDKYSFKSNSDTETLLYGFQEYGVELFNMLNGIFAFAILDRTTGELILCRDQFGVKPLYYSHSNGCLLFSSEIKSILEYPKFRKDIDLSSLPNYLYFLWSPGEKTPFEYCKKLLPGHYLKTNIKSPQEIAIYKYYELPFTGVYEEKTETEWIDLLDEKLTKAVERQLLSDVPVGFFLSGGLDSSLIVAIAKKLYPDKKFKCFTIQTDVNSKREGFEDDLSYAKKVADYLKVDLEIVKSDIQIVRDFDQMIYHLDEPQADPAPLNISNICESARAQGYVVLLGGTAGDDLFSGYRRHQSLFFENKMSLVPFALKKLLYRISSNLPGRKASFRRFKKFFSTYRYPDKESRSASLYGWLPVERVKRLFSNEVAFNPNDFLISSLTCIPDEKSPLNQMLFWDLKFFLTDHNLNYTDKMSMMHGVEVRVPFLDIDLVNISASIPPSLKMKGTETKYLLKKVAERYLPREVIYRPKTGFGAPVRDWVIDELGDKIKSNLSQEKLAKRSIFVSKEIDMLIEQNKAGVIDASYTIWALLAIESWFKQFVDNE
ncbi:asparagine synthase (glutamine-hydrolyzing) [Daejeonella lutea]|uniref:asparagine synthase (glutamine-hydrolyzing) n=1 Tax=Daejeonella lutea TaxID=572036 RepID=A0A1T5FAZ0_9SPHI|nr:asparagine synthase (glutamine-hydrolyzing) [Daejeonella lutea]SKB93314.1 asparagine synthase (glutamine-hydrolysing) [Daejeonella lutea]